MSNEQIDNTLLGILQHTNSLSNFFDTVFSFLMRRTDFYYHATPENKKLGFPPGVNAEMVLKNMQAAASVKTKKPVESHNTNDKTPSDSSKDDTLSVVKEKVIGAPECSVDEKGENRCYLADADCYNGAVRSDYSWGQKIGEADIRIDIPEPYVSKDLKVNIEKNKIVIKGKKDSNLITLFDKQLCWEIKPDPQWYFEKKERKLVIDVEKRQERWWDSFFTDEEKINTRKIDCSRPITEIDEEGQAKIHQLMYDQKQKQLGKPTSEQQRINDVLKDAWHADGSPFKGQPFDPSKLNISDGSSSEM